MGEVARVLEPVVGALPGEYPDWVKASTIKLEKLNHCNSLEELQKLGALMEVRELKLALREHYLRYLVPGGLYPVQFSGPPRVFSAPCISICTPFATPSPSLKGAASPKWIAAKPA